MPALIVQGFYLLSWFCLAGVVLGLCAKFIQKDCEEE